MPPRRRAAKRKRSIDHVEDDEGDSTFGTHHESPITSEAPPTASPSSSTIQNDTNALVVNDALHESPTGSQIAEASQLEWNGPLVGYCFCQDWKVTIKEPISGVVVCHCRDCQAISSSFFCTFLTVKSRALLMVEPSDRESRNVESATYYYTIKTGDNAGRTQSRTFCKRCGTVIFATPESLEGALPVNRNLFVGPHVKMTPALRELLTPKIEIFTKDRSAWRPGQEGVLHQYISMPMGFGDSGSSGNAEINPALTSGELHL